MGEAMEKYGAILVSAMVVVTFGAVLMIWLLRPMVLQGSTSEVINILLGTLAANFTTVCNYWIGSSSGSKGKDETIAAIAAK